MYRLDKNSFALTELLTLPNKVNSGIFLKNIFFYLNQNAKLNVIINNKSFFIRNYDKKKFILGAIEPQNRMYFFDRSNQFYSLHIEFEFFQNLEKFIHQKGNGNIPEIPEGHRDLAAKILN